MSNRTLRKPRANAEAQTLWNRVWARLFEPVDAASVVTARIAFGLLLAWESYRFLLLGRIELKWVSPATLIGWPGFEWVQRWPGDGMYLHFYALGFCALCIAAGFCYRLAAVLFCLGWTHVLLLSMAFYNNHYYLIALLGGLWALAPANRTFAVDAWLRPATRRETIPAWSLWLLRAQLGVVYFYGGIAKLHADWLLGYPMHLWLPRVSQLPILSELFQPYWVAVAMSWGGLFLDLLAVPALLWRRSRPFMFAALLGFHLWNSQIFTIGVFPWLAISLTTLYFDPDWPRRVFNWPRRVALPAPAPFKWTTGRKALAAFLSVYMLIQLTVPLRHYFYAGNARWSGEGSYFSWHMMLRKKRGHVSYVLTDSETEESWWVDPRKEIDSLQYRQLAGDASMIHLYGRRLARLAEEAGHKRVKVRAVGVVSLNDREPEPLIDPYANLAALEPHLFGHAPWVLPVTKPLGRDWITGKEDEWFERTGDDWSVRPTNEPRAAPAWDFE